MDLGPKTCLRLIAVTFVVVPVLAVLAGCTPENRGTDPTSSASSPSALTSAPAAAADPSFDCAAADSEAQKAVCADPQLATLDRQLNDEFQHTLAQPGANENTLQSAQRGWAAGRDDCWKADDIHRCVLDAYRTRLVQLKLDDADTVTPSTVSYRCPGDKPFTARFYNQFDPPTAVLTWGTDTATVFAEQSGSGAKYGRTGVEFWEHQGEVTVDFFGNKFVCTTP
jgi:uncharacterized protein